MLSERDAGCGPREKVNLRFRNSDDHAGAGLRNLDSA